MAKKSRPKVKAVNLDGVSMNKNSFAQYETEADFLAAMEAPEAQHYFEGNPNREEKLKKMYELGSAHVEHEAEVEAKKAAKKTATKKAPVKKGKK